ncbi:MAG: class I tRNA ligase family protein, partial [Pseudomonadales bacterium]|nr:class I tRNA ligase family protein [Pseudomonadales bacterium]
AWIISRLQTLKEDIGAEMKRYRLYNVVPKLFSFIADLTNWYIRLNRARFWSEGVTADKIAAYSTLHTAVYELSVAMAPFAPFLSEHIYLSFARLADEAPTPLSVHLCTYPEAEPSLRQPLLEDAVSRMQQVIELGRSKRERVKINLRTPLRTLTIIHRDAGLLEEIKSLESYLKAELNVKEVRYETDEARYIALYARPNFPVLGKRLGRRMKEFQGKIAALDPDAIEAFQACGSVVIDGETFDGDDIHVFREAKEGTETVSNRFVSIELDCRLDDELLREGVAREVVNRIQRARKDSGFAVSDRIHVVYDADEDVAEAIGAHGDYIAGETLALSLEPEDVADGATETAIDGKRLVFSMTVAQTGA